MQSTQDLQSNLVELTNILQAILNNDNTMRKQAEDQLNGLKRNDPNKYCQVMVYLMHPQFAASPEVKSLSAVILRRNISTSSIDVSDVNDVSNNDNLWQRLSNECRTGIKVQLIEVLRGSAEWPKHLTHKICSLAVEV